MGYRSDVSFAIPQSKYVELERLATDWDQQHQSEWGCKDLLACADEVREFKYCDEDWVLVTWTSIKWYSNMGSETPVDVIEDFVRNLPEYQFARIGESSEDTEEYFSGDEQFLFITRSIELAV